MFDRKHFPYECYNNVQKGFPGGSVVKNPPAKAGDMGLIPGLRSPHHTHTITPQTPTPHTDTHTTHGHYTTHRHIQMHIHAYTYTTTYAQMCTHKYTCIYT